MNRIHSLSVLAQISVCLIIDKFYCPGHMTSYGTLTPLIVDSEAQLVERRSSIPKVVGSNPTGVSDFFFH